MKCSNYKDLERHLSASECERISFDVFDTLLQRDCTPDYLLRYLSFRVRDLLVEDGFEIVADPLQARHESHVLACSELLNDGDDHDLTLLEWIPFWIKLLTGASRDPDLELVRRVYELELECELAFLRPNLKMLEICRALLLRGRRMIFCSDMYLGKAAIEYFLDRLGYGGIFECGFCSGDLRKLKRSGRLFEYVAKELQLSYDSILHVGDNEKADYRIPISMGIASVLLITEDQVGRHENLLENEDKESVLPKFTGVNAYQYCLSRSGAFESSEEQVGYRIFGAPLCLFAHRMVEYCIENSIKRVYFLAREGFLLKGLFERVLKDYAVSGGGISAHYLAVSRQTSFLASANSFGLREIASTIANGPRVTLKGLFAPFGIPDEKLIEVGKRYGFQFPDIDLPAFFMDWPPLHKIINDPEIVRHVQGKIQSSKTLLCDYLKQEGFLAGGKLALVDVGWSGQIQDNIYQATIENEQRPEIHGLYFGTRIRARQRANLENRFVSLMCDDMENLWHRNEALRFVFPWEILPRAPHGTVVTYRREDARIKPVFKHAAEPSRQAEIRDEARLLNFQKGVYRFACVYQDYWKVVRPFSLHLIDAFLLPFYGLSRYPCSTDLKTIGTLRNVSDLGSNDIISLIEGKGLNHWKHSLWPGGQLMSGGISRRQCKRIYKKEAVRGLRSKCFKDEHWVNYPIEFGRTQLNVEIAVLQTRTLTDEIHEEYLQANDYRVSAKSCKFNISCSYESLIHWLADDYAIVKAANCRAYFMRKEMYEISGSLLRELKRRIRMKSL